MKKNLIITLALGLFLMSCKNSNERPDAKSGKNGTKLTAQVSKPGLACVSYSIFNQHGPLGPTVLYSYLDCNGALIEGSVEPLATVFVLAQQGTVKCPGGVVTEGGISTKTTSGVSQIINNAQSKP